MQGFRIWKAETKYMTTVGEYLLSMDGTLITAIEDCTEPLYDFDFDTESVVMQSTGIKDQDGTMIYEGDQVRLEVDGKTACFEVSVYKHNLILILYDAIVFYDASWLYSDLIEYGDEFEYLYLASIPENSKLWIIGNIYEEDSIL